MSLFKNPNKTFTKLILLVCWLATPALAHEVEVHHDVAVTFHIDPNDQPKANRPSKAWFQVTLAGGKLISLADCNCQLVVYSISDPKTQKPWLKPPLSAFSSDRHKDVMAAQIVFPKVGLYELKLTGTAKNNVNFKPFTASYKVTVTP